MKTKGRWYENATFYAIDVEAFAPDETDAEATLELAHEPVRLFGEAEFERVGDSGGTDTDGTGKWRFGLGRYGYCWVRVEEEV